MAATHPLPALAGISADPVDAAGRTPLDRLLDPHSVAVIGASTDPGKRGYQAVRALHRGGFRYPVYPVNPRGGKLLGLSVLTGIDQLPFGVDTALVALPGRAVPDVLRELAQVGVAGAVVLANGFREIGPAGAALEDELSAAIAETGIRVVGPNTSGILNAASGANLVGVSDVPVGPVSILTQSGNMLLSLLADDRAGGGPGFHSYIGLGNQVDIGYHECLTYLAGQPDTRSIAVHTEGFADGRAFLVAAARATRSCPVVVLRGGRSEAGRRSALSHTGSVAGSDAVAGAVLSQAGVELVERSDELAMLAGVLAIADPVPAGQGVAVLSDGGGQATLAADALSAAGVELAVLAEDTRSALRALLGKPASVANPVDVAGATDTDPALFATAADLLFRDPAVGVVLIVGLFGGYHLRFDPALKDVEEATAAALGSLAARHRLPLLVQSCYAVDRPASHDILRAAGVPVLASIDHATRAVTALRRRGLRLATADKRSSLQLPTAQATGIVGHPATGAGRAVSSPHSPAGLHERSSAGHPATGAGRAVRVLDEPSARGLVESAGLDAGRWSLVRSPEQAVTAVRAYGGPCALKVVSPHVVHKSDAGGVRLGVTVDTVATEWAAIRDSVTSAVPSAEITGMIVTPMAPVGVELLVGATVDPVFGPIVAFGTGGVLVEALADVTFRAAPFTRLEAREMIEETAASRMLDGYRHLPAVNRDVLAGFLVRVGDLAAHTPDLAELDLNPVVANGSKIVPLDVRVVLNREG
jgi:acetate---CoA ligase (ADP-forming)